MAILPVSTYLTAVKKKKKKRKEEKKKKRKKQYFPGRNLQGAVAGCDRTDGGRCIIKPATVSMALL